MYAPADPTKVLSMKQCQEFADLVIQSPIFRAWRIIDKVHLKNGVVNALGSYTKQLISLPKWARTELVILHELCHLAIWHIKLPGHGKEFAGLLLDLVREFMGKRYANELEASFIKHKVQYNIDEAWL